MWYKLQKYNYQKRATYFTRFWLMQGLGKGIIYVALTPVGEASFFVAEAHDYQLPSHTKATLSLRSVLATEILS